MPDIPNRTELETEVARRFARLSADHKRRLITLLGDPPNFGNIPQSFWDDMVGELNAGLSPLLTEIYMDAAEVLVAGIPVGVDWGLVNERAAAWARGYSYDLVRGITATSRRAAQEAVSAFFTQAQTRGDLEARLARIFVGASRVESIAVTEVTRAAVEAEIEIAEELLDTGVEMIAVWNTSNDELVCPICAPLNQREADGYTGKRRPYWIHPDTGSQIEVVPHPRDRCWISWELPKVRHR